MTRTSLRACSLAASLGALAACGSRGGAPAEAHLSLPAGGVAAVGTDVVELATVERVARAQGLSLVAARDRAVSDALLAAHARAALGDATASHARGGALARALLESFSAEALRQGPPTDAEVAVATESRWWELDQPPLLRTTHAVVVVKKPADDSAAHAVADRIAIAVEGAKDAATFRKAASAVPSGGLDLRVEDLDPVARDRRAVNPASPPPAGSRTAQYDAAFVDAAFAIPSVGRSSPVVRTEFGYHVILATERVPERRTPLEDRRRMLEPEVLLRRATELRDQVLRQARAGELVEVERAALELMEKIRLDP